MMTFTVSYCEFISSLKMSTSPSCSFSWGEIDSLVSPSLATAYPASSATTFCRYSLCPTLCLHHTPTSLSVRSVLLPTLLLNLTLARSSSRSTKALLQRPDHKRPVSNKIGSCNSQVHQAPLFQIGYCVVKTMLALQYHQLT